MMRTLPSTNNSSPSALDNHVNGEKKNSPCEKKGSNASSTSGSTRRLPRSSKLLKQPPRSLEIMEKGMSMLQFNHQDDKNNDHSEMKPHIRRNCTKQDDTCRRRLRLRRALFVCNFCNSITQTIPVVLLPLIAAEHHRQRQSTSFIATAASVSTFGGAVGQFVNGFICQRWGGKLSSSYYMMGMALCAFLLSQISSNNATLTYILLFSMEFLASIQWTCSSMILCNHFETTSTIFATGITEMSLANTIGILSSKAMGVALLQLLPWRVVSQWAAGVAVIGAMVMHTMVDEFPSSTSIVPPRPNVSILRIGTSCKAILGSKLFWILGLAHSISSLASTSDRVLGSFFEDVSMLPRSICGGFTASVTLGFIHGLYTSNMTTTKSDLRQRLRFRYTSAVMAALVMAMTAFMSKLYRPYLTACLLVISSATMASSLAFQFYQIPNMVASVYGEHQAVCLSFMDGVGYSMAAPIWALVGNIVAKAPPSMGWCVAWMLLAGLFGIGGSTMMNTLPTIWEQQQQQQQQLQLEVQSSKTLGKKRFVGSNEL